MLPINNVIFVSVDPNTGQLAVDQDGLPIRALQPTIFVDQSGNQTQAPHEIVTLPEGQQVSQTIVDGPDGQKHIQLSTAMTINSEGQLQHVNPTMVSLLSYTVILISAQLLSSN